MIRLELNNSIYECGGGVFTSNPNAFIVARLTVNDVVAELLRTKEMETNTYHFKIHNLATGFSGTGRLCNDIPPLDEILGSLCTLVEKQSDSIAIYPAIVETKLPPYMVMNEFQNCVINKTFGMVTPICISFAPNQVSRSSFLLCALNEKGHTYSQRTDLQELFYKFEEMIQKDLLEAIS